MGDRQRDETQPKVIWLSALPGSDKDHWIRTHGGNLSVFFLDEIRQEMSYTPGKVGAVIQLARSSPSRLENVRPIVKLSNVRHSALLLEGRSKSFGYFRYCVDRDFRSIRDPLSIK